MLPESSLSTWYGADMLKLYSLERIEKFDIFLENSNYAVTSIKFIVVGERQHVTLAWFIIRRNLSLQFTLHCNHTYYQLFTPFSHHSNQIKFSLVFSFKWIQTMQSKTVKSGKLHYCIRNSKDFAIQNGL